MIAPDSAIRHPRPHHADARGQGAAPAVHTLEHGLEPLRTWFDGNVDRVRVVASLSSTCAMCVRGRRVGLEPLLARETDFRMAWVFIDMLETDTHATAVEAAAQVSDARLTAFHDPHRDFGHALARCLGWQGHVAWDTYAIYEAGARWTGPGVPTPTDWYHQLQDREVWRQTAAADVGCTDWTASLAERSEADPARFVTGEALRAAIEDAITTTHRTCRS